MPTTPHPASDRQPGAPNGAPPVAWAVVPVGVAAFWGGTWMAARHYPQEYDWRYMTISSLLSAERNPAGHLWASAGVVACGICGYCWAALWIRRTRRYGANDPGFAVRALQFGYACMVLTAALPDGLLPIAKGHEMLAILAFAGVSYGMVRMYQRSVLHRMVRPDGHRRWWPGLLVALAVLPILLAAGAQAYVFLERPDLPWVNLTWRARGVPVYISFAFWEWLTCLVLSAYMTMLVLLHVLSPRRDAPGGVPARRKF